LGFIPLPDDFPLDFMGGGILPPFSDLSGIVLVEHLDFMANSYL
jgi:hypothetical protein